MHRRVVTVLSVFTLLLFGMSNTFIQKVTAQQQQFPTIAVPEGYRIEKFVGGLTFPTAMTWDDQGRMYVAEAGGGLDVEQLQPSRIMRVEQGRATEHINLTDKGVFASVVGLTWHNGAFYFTHRDDPGLTGAASRVTMDGTVTPLFSGIIDSQAEHQINDIKVGPDGRMFVTVGPAGNSGVVDPSIAPWVMENPNLHTTACQDIVLTGRNFKMPNFMTMNDPNDTVMTGAYVPFGTETQPGQVIKGTNKCGGSILVFDPNNAEATIRPYAWGFRNLLGLAWNKRTGEMYVGQNGYDIRGSRPVQDEFDPTYRVREGAWYGVPDFSAAFEPLTDPKFEPPDEFQAEVFVNGQSVGKTLGFVIDHAASGLTPPDKSLILGLHEVNSSPSFLDVAPDSWGEFAGDVFVAEWGDLAPPTNPLRGKKPAGYQVTRVDTQTGQVVPFVRNQQPGPASMQGAVGQGIERPFDVKFGPDGAMYISDYGIVTIDMNKKPPYVYAPGSGAIWKVTRTAAQQPGQPQVPAPASNMELSASLSGQAEVPNPGDPDGSGMAMVTLKAATGEVCWDMMVSNITLPAAAAHIHEGGPGVAGPVVVPLSAPGANGGASGCTKADAALIGRIGQNPGGFYVNVHTSDYPMGAVRGQLAISTAQPGQPPQLPNTSEVAAPTITFPETGYSVSGEFLNYWRTNGGLPVFGYPIDSERQTGGQVSQWFERNRLELHPENTAPYNVLLGRLGVEALEQQGRDWHTFAKADPSAPHYFKETGHAIAPQFWDYYRSHGLDFGDRGVSARESLALFGYPISEAQMEQNSSGDMVLTQWFERARFEYHPDNPAKYNILLGRLGAETRSARGR